MVKPLYLYRDLWVWNTAFDIYGPLGAIMVLITSEANQESRAQFENPIKLPVHVRLVTRSTMYDKAPFYYPELA